MAGNSAAREAHPGKVFRLGGDAMKQLKQDAIVFTSCFIFWLALYAAWIMGTGGF